MIPYKEFTPADFKDFISDFDREELVDAQRELQIDEELPKKIRGQFLRLIGDQLSAVKGKKSKPLVVSTVLRNNSYKMFVTKKDIGDLLLETTHNIEAILSYSIITDAQFKELANIYPVV